MMKKLIHILVIEDEEALADMVRRAFASHEGSFAITIVNCLSEARIFLDKTSPDLIITDVILPDGKGTDLEAAPKNRRSLPVVVMTGHGEEQAAAEAMKAGALDYIVKSPEAIADIPHVAEHTLREWQHIIEHRRVEAMLDQFFHLSIDMLCVVDLQGRFQYVNPAFEHTLGYKPSQLLSRPYIDFVHPEDKAATEAAAKGLALGKPVINLENRYLCKQGNYKWLDWTSKPDIKARVAYAIARDITGEKKAVLERDRLERQLQQAQKMEAIGTLAGGIAHDFNNILGAIMGYSELGKLEAPEGSRISAYMDRVLKAANRAKDLVRQILAFSRQNEQQEKPIHLAPIIKEALKMLRASIPATIEIRQDIGDESGTVVADPTHIYQVLMNLCTNAAYAMQDTGGVLEILLEDVDIEGETGVESPHLEPGTYERLTVKDTGHGMNQAIKERIFDPYFTTKEKGVGTGLGLAAVHGIVKRCNGAISVDSKPGHGATFRVFLPRTDTDIIQEAEPSRPLPMGNEHILLVDDENALIHISEQMLRRLGYAVTTKTNPLETLKIFRASPEAFDLVITDQTMPLMTGQRLAKELLRVRTDIPIILCTGYSDLVTPDNAKAAGVREFVMKPLVMSELANTVRKVLDAL